MAIYRERRIQKRPPTLGSLDKFNIGAQVTSDRKPAEKLLCFCDPQPGGYSQRVRFGKLTLSQSEGAEKRIPG